MLQIPYTHKLVWKLQHDDTEKSHSSIARLDHKNLTCEQKFYLEHKKKVR